MPIFFRFDSPISVGIYGHPAYERSIFQLDILKQSNEIPSYATITSEVPEIELSDLKYKVIEDKGDIQKNNVKLKHKKVVEKMSNKHSVIFSLLEVFQLIFL